MATKKAVKKSPVKKAVVKKKAPVTKKQVDAKAKKIGRSIAALQKKVAPKKVDLADVGKARRKSADKSVLEMTIDSFAKHLQKFIDVSVKASVKDAFEDAYKIINIYDQVGNIRNKMDDEMYVELMSADDEVLKGKAISDVPALALRNLMAAHEALYGARTVKVAEVAPTVAEPTPEVIDDEL
jgi:vesicle coat complex subunit